MNHAKDLLAAFMQYYGTSQRQPKYSMGMASEIADKYAWIGERYKVLLYDEVIREFVPTAARPLPDMAALVKAERNLPPPETVIDRTRKLPEPMNVDKNPRDRQVWLDFLARIGSELGSRAERTGERNHRERERIRRKVANGFGARSRRATLRFTSAGGFT